MARSWPARLNRALAAVADEFRAQEGPLVPWAFPSGAEIDRPLRRLPVFLAIVALAAGLCAYLVEPRPVRLGHALASGLAALALVAVQALAYSAREDTAARVALTAALASVAIVQVALQRWYGPGLLGIPLTMVWSARVGVLGLPVAVVAVAGYLTAVVLSSNDPTSPGAVPVRPRSLWPCTPAPCWAGVTAAGASSRRRPRRGPGWRGRSTTCSPTP